MKLTLEKKLKDFVTNSEAIWLKVFYYLEYEIRLLTFLNNWKDLTNKDLYHWLN